MTRSVLRETDDPRAVAQYAWRILHWLRDPERTGRPFTYAQIREGVGAGRNFSVAVSIARVIAREHDEIITNCRREADDWYLWHLYPDEERGLMMPTMETRDSVVTGINRNHAGQMEWMGRHAEDPLERRWARAKSAQLAANLAVDEEMSGLRDEIRRHRETRLSESP